MSETIKEETAEAVQAEPQGLTLEKFEEATEVVSKVISETKLVYSEYFSNLTGNKVYLKPENMQYTGAYKVRGAYYKISTMSEEERKKGLITASAGNHAQGVAYAAKKYGVKATVVMPTTTPLIKVNRTKGYGAEVVLYGNVYDEACEYALKLAKEVDADIVLATDPDADRLGVYCKDTKTGEYVTFTGNMSGMLIAEYILREKTATGTMPENPALVETIVTTDMAKAMAASYGVALIEVLTGFKYIGEQIKWFEQNHSHNYVFGLEESYGCLAGTYARDKDACVAVMMLCEVASWCKKHGKTLWDAMIDLYEKYGYYREGLSTMTLKGIDGAAQIQQMMSDMRNNPKKTLGGFEVLAVRDYKEDTRKDLKTGEVTKTGLPASNVLYYELSDNAWCCVRPSGTEPKIKFYYGVKGTSLQDAEEKLEALKKDLVEE